MSKSDRSRKEQKTLVPTEQPVPATQPVVWKPEDVKNFIEMIRSLGKELIDYKNKEFDYKVRRLGSVGAHNRRITYSLLLFLTGLIVVMSVLTFFGKVSGDALLFLAGTITGYVVLMIQALTYPLFEGEPSQES